MPRKVSVVAGGGQRSRQLQAAGGSGCGESGKTTGGEGDQWQGVSWAWCVVHGQEWASKCGADGWQETKVGDDRQRPRRKGLGSGLSYSPIATSRGAKPTRH